MNESIRKNGINFGIIVGVISILITTIMYTVDITLFASIWIGLLILAINIVIGIVAVAKTKKAMANVITFKEAFTVFFIAMALGALLSTIFMYVLFNLIDPEAKTIITDKIIEGTVKWMQSAGTQTDMITQTVEEMRKTDNFSLMSQVKSYFGILILYIVIGLIVAAVFKTKAKAEY